MNLRPSGYEPDELPNCSTPRWTSNHTRRSRKLPVGAQDLLNLPELHRVGFRIAELGESAVVVHLFVDLDLDAGATQLGHHGVEIVDPKVDPHPVAPMCGLSQCSSPNGANRWLSLRRRAHSADRLAP